MEFFKLFQDTFFDNFDVYAMKFKYDYL